MPSLAVVGSVNIDLVARCRRLPTPGETVTGAVFARHPGGKGANQALAACRMGAEVSLTGRVGSDPFAEEALALLRGSGVNLASVTRDPFNPTGVALILVSDVGENQIVVAPGANLGLTLSQVEVRGMDAVLCQLEVPIEIVAEAGEQAGGLFCLNAAPAQPVPDAVLDRADLVVVNQTEWQLLGPSLDRCQGLVALTLGAGGARLYRKDKQVSAATSPELKVVDTVGAGDAFCGALVVSLLEGRTVDQSLQRACAAGALAASGSGAQASLPTADQVDTLLAGY